ncbi:MAG: GvpL/GvpF family gas vesicle protein [Bacillota bacterium]
MLYLYCLMDAPQIDLLPYSGIKGRRPFFVKWKDVAAAVSDLESPEIELTSESVLSHEGIVEYLFQNHTVLPVRFGSVLSETREVKHFLERHYNVITKNIEKVKGKVELGLKVIFKEQEPCPVKAEEAILEENKTDRISPAKSYLISKLQEEKKRQYLMEEAGKYIDEIYNTLRSYTTQSCIRKLTTEKMILNSSYLVRRDQVAAFTVSVDWLKNKYPFLSFLYSGPWPPYNFVGLEEGTQQDA